jgi:hypothetical protein
MTLLPSNLVSILSVGQSNTLRSFRVNRNRKGELAMMDYLPKSRANLVWIILIFGLGLGGMYLLAGAQGKSMPGLIMVEAMLLLLWYSQAKGAPPGLWLRAYDYLTLHPHLSLVPMAAGLSLLTTLLAARVETHPDVTLYNLSVFLWLLSGLTLILACVRLSWSQLKTWWQVYRWEVILVVGLTGLAGALRFYQLGSLPNIINGDEGWTGLAALKLLPAMDFLYSHPFSFFQGFGRVYLNLIAGAINFFGRTPFSLRLLPAMGGMLAIPATYLLARRLLDVRGATLAALMLAVAHAHVHFSRTAAVAYIQCTWLSPLELYFFLTGLERRDRARMTIGGLLLGLHFNFYYGAQINAGFLLVFVLVAALLDRPLIRENLAGLGWFFGSALLLALPGLTWAFHHPQDFFTRWLMEGTFQSGWLPLEIARTGQPVALILWQRFAHVLLSIFALPFEDFYFGGAPVLDFITATLFLAGLLTALNRVRQLRFLLLNGWFWSGVLAISFLVVPPWADSYRLLVVLPTICILASLGLEQLLQLVEPVLSPPGRLALANWSLIFILPIAGLNLKTYYVDFAHDCTYAVDSVGRAWSLIGDYLREQRPFDQAYLVGDGTFHYGTHPSVDYLSGSVPMTNLIDPFSPPAIQGSLIFILTPSRANELAAILNFAPGGQITRVSDCNQLSFITYRVEKT